MVQGAIQKTARCGTCTTENVPVTRTNNLRVHRDRGARCPGSSRWAFTHSWPARNALPDPHTPTDRHGIPSENARDGEGTRAPALRGAAPGMTSESPEAVL